MPVLKIDGTAAVLLVLLVKKSAAGEKGGAGTERKVLDDTLRMSKTGLAAVSAAAALALLSLFPTRLIMAIAHFMLTAQ